MRYRFVGDVHGDFHRFTRQLRRWEGNGRAVVQVGDLGVGFGDTSLLDGLDFHFIHGNHDNPDASALLPQFLGRYGMLADRTLFISGGWSIDANYRSAGVDWWPNEELSLGEWKLIRELARAEADNIDIVVSHDCPYSLYNKVLDKGQPRVLNRQAFNLDLLFDVVQPKHWVFGHHHKWFTEKVSRKGNTTTFHCVPENKYLDLDVTGEQHGNA